MNKLLNEVLNEKISNKKRQEVIEYYEYLIDILKNKNGRDDLARRIADDEALLPGDVDELDKKLFIKKFK